MRLATLQKMRGRNPQGSLRRKESALGSSARSLTCSSNPSRSSQRCQSSARLGERMNSQLLYRAKERQGRVSRENVSIKSNLLPCYAAVCAFQLIRKRGAEFHKLSPENVGKRWSRREWQQLKDVQSCFSLFQ